MITATIRQIGGTLAPVAVNNGSNVLATLTPAQLFFTFLLTVGVVLLFCLLNQWIWNNVLTKYVTIVNPIPNLWEFILLSYLIMSFHGQM